MPHEIAKETEAIQRGYEDSHVKPQLLLGVGAAVVALVIIGIVGSYAAFRFFEKTESMGPDATPFAVAPEPPPEPRLQTDAPQDLQRYREAQEKILANYGWVDKNAGIVRIPISRAMDLVLQKGLPTAASGAVKTPATPGQPAAVPAAPLTAPTPVDGEEAH